MRPGPELDAEIARKLWRYLIIFEAETGTYAMMSAFGCESIPAFSTSNEAAEQVTEFYREKGWKLRSRKEGKGFAAAFTKKDGAQYRFFCAETLAEAICNAALAVENGTHIQTKPDK